MPPRKNQPAKSDLAAIDKIASAILAIIGQFPTTERKRRLPEVAARTKANETAAKAALAAGALALPSGPVAC